MHEAGIEGSYVLMDVLQQNNFFYEQHFFNEALYWVGCLLSEVSYVAGSSFAFSDDMSSDSDIPLERDFTGNDVRAWVYDLFRPDEPYSVRGTHPSGIGIKRNIRTTDLTDEEMRYLKAQGWWQIANFVSPMLFGFRSLNWGNTGIRWNFALRHNLTSFGTDFSIKGMVAFNEYKILGALHNYMNYHGVFPAIEAKFVDYPVQLTTNLGLLITPQIMIGNQPENQVFKTKTPEFFGFLGCRADIDFKDNFLPYIEVIAKTDGWVAGNEYLERNIGGRIGISARF